MSIFNSPRLRERGQGLDALNEISKDKLKCLVIHYSCESFVTNHGKTPRITSICIRNLKTAQTKSYSIHLQAQISGLDFNNLENHDYDTLEKEMLNDFSNYVKSHPAHKWVHWNMRDSNFGFEAINNRIKILGGQSFDIADDFKYDFPRLLGQIYTYGYEKHQPLGKMLNLVQRNNITIQGALTGANEAEAFDKKEYLKLHISTLKKVDIIESIIHKTQNSELLVIASTKVIYGLSVPGVISIIRETPWLLLLVGFIGYLLGAALEPVVQFLFGTSKIQ